MTRAQQEGPQTAAAKPLAMADLDLPDYHALDRLYSLQSEERQERRGLETRASASIAAALTAVAFSANAVSDRLPEAKASAIACLASGGALVFVGVFSRLPRTAASRRGRSRRRRNAIAGVVAGLGAFATIWAALSRPAPEQSVATQHIVRADDAHGGDVVTVILADFRGFDTMVEITVLAVAIIGVASLLRRGRPW